MQTRVTSEPVSEPITLTQAKDFLNITNADHDSKITAGIKAARLKVEKLSGRSLAAKTYEFTMHDYSDSCIDLPYPDVDAIVSVKATDSDGTEETLTEYSLVGSRLYLYGDGRYLTIEYTTTDNTQEFYKLAVKKQLAYDFRNAFDDNGFDQEVIKMISTDTVNLGY